MFCALLISTLESVEVTYENHNLTVNGFGYITAQEFSRAYRSLVNLSFISRLLIPGNFYSLDSDTFKVIVEDGKAEDITQVIFSSVVSLPDNVFGEEFFNIGNVELGSKIRYIGKNFLNTTGISLDIGPQVEVIHPQTVASLGEFKLDPKNTKYATCTPDDKTYLLYPNKSTIYSVSGTNEGSINFTFPSCIKKTTASNLIIDAYLIDFNKVEEIGEHTGSMFISTSSHITINGLDNVKKIGIGGLHIRNINQFTLPSSIESLSRHFTTPGVKITFDGNAVYEKKKIGSYQCIIEKSTKTILHSYFEDEEVRDLELDGYVLTESLFAESSIKTLTLRNIKEIPDQCFEGSSIEKIDMPGVQKIGDYAFYYISPPTGTIDRTTIVLPDGLESIGKYAFYSVKISIDKNTLPTGVRQIGQSAFQLADISNSLTVSLPNVEVFESDIFNGVSISGAINIPKAKEIKSGAFASRGQASVSLPSTLISLSARSFSDSVTVSGNYKKEDGFIYNQDKTILFGFNRAEASTAQKKITFGSVKTICSDVFSKADLKEYEFDFPNVETIGASAFEGCSLKKLVVGSKYKIVQSFTFARFKAESIELKAPVFEKVEGSLDLEGPDIIVPKVKAGQDVVVTVKQSAKAPRSYDFTSFRVDVRLDGEGKDICTVSGAKVTTENLYYPCQSVIFDESVIQVQNARSLLEHATSIEIKGAERILSESIDGWELVSLKLPNTLKRLSSLELPMPVFHGKTAIHIEGGGKYVVKDKMILSKDEHVLVAVLGKVDDLRFPESVMEIRPYALYGIGDLERLVIPGTVRRICDDAFMKYINELILEEGVEELGRIGETIESITIPKSLKKVTGVGLGRLITFGRANITEGCGALKEVNGVIYDSEQKIAIDVVDFRNTKEVHFDCEIVDVQSLRGSQTLTKVTFSNKVREISGDFMNCANAEIVLPKLLEYRSSFKFMNFVGPCVIDNSHGQLPMIADRALPCGVTQIVVKYYSYPSVELGYSPTIHVPANYKSSDLFGSHNLIRDQDRVEEVEPKIPKEKEYQVEGIWSDDGTVFDPTPEPSDDESSNTGNGGNDGSGDNNQNESGGGLKGGEIAGIAIGVVVIVAAIVGAAIFFVVRRRNVSEKVGLAKERMPDDYYATNDVEI